ncbi:hypothetical protein [Cupriavidus oxalaticus]|uniref:hypothetical protein n=1 Tax=Cupriavidus oxalaticus TaxID=96344 RepID=UPI00403424FF
MPFCDLCLSQLDRPGHFPPHAGLLKSATLRTSSGQNVFVYRCGACGESLLLASADGEAPDRWTRLDTDGWR